MGLAPIEQRKKFGNGELLQPAPPSLPTNISKCLDTIEVKWKRRNTFAAIWKQWPELTGNKLAQNCWPIRLSRGVLYIGASHPQWRQALQYSRIQLLSSIRAAGHEIKELRIQQYYPSFKSSEKIEDQKQIWKNHPSRVDIHGLDNCSHCGSPAPAGETKLWGMCSFCRRKKI